MTHCEVCHEREAVVHLTEGEGNQARTLHLCSRCAVERGAAIDAGTVGMPLAAFLAAMGGGGVMLASAGAQSVHCPACDATLGDFQASGRLGCPTCWTTFERSLRELLRRIHGAARHVGGRPADGDVVEGGGSAVSQQVERLRAGLAAAIREERFEEAAVLRDRLHTLTEEAEGE